MPRTTPTMRLAAAGICVCLLAAALAPEPARAADARAADARVSVVRSDWAALEAPVAIDQELDRGQIEALVRAALLPLGGMSAFVDAGDDWVMIKPNIVALSARGSGDITDAWVTWSIARLVHEVNPAARITIAEGSAGWISPGHPEALEAQEVADGFANTGFREIASDPQLSAVVDFMDLNFEDSVPVIGAATGDTYWLPKAVRDCDVFISNPVLKTTNVIGYTGTMKNLVGIMPGMKYGWSKTEGFPPFSGNPGMPNHRAGRYDEMIVDLTSFAGVDLAIIDAVVGLERGRVRDTGGQPKRLNAILAGADPVAVDVAGTLVMGFNPDDFEFLTLADRLGVGVGDVQRVELIGQPLDEVAARFEKKPRWDDRSHYGQGNRTWLLKGPFDLGDDDRWQPDPASLAPVPGRDGWSEAVYFGDDKINLKWRFGRVRDVVAYAYAEFDAPAAGAAELWVGSDEDLTVWLNGEQAYHFEGRRRHTLPNDEVPVQLRAGRNTLLVEAAQWFRDFDFSVNVCEPEEDERFDGNRVRGLRFSTPGAPVAATVVDSSNQLSEYLPVEITGWHTQKRFEARVEATYSVADGLSDDDVNHLAAGPDGRMWAQQRSAVMRLEEDNRWHPVFPGDEGLQDMWIREVLVDGDGTFWAATSEGIKRGAADSIDTAENGMWIGDLVQAFDGRVFAGGWGTPLREYVDGRWRLTDVSGSYLEKLGGEPRIVSMAGDAKGLWVGIWGRGILRWDGKNWERLTTLSGLGDNHPERMRGGPGGQALVYYDQAGLDWYDGRRWRYTTDVNGLFDAEVHALTIDGDGRPWVSTGEGSLACLVDGEWVTALTSKPVTAIAADARGRLWLSGDGGTITVLAVDLKGRRVSRR